MRQQRAIITHFDGDPFILSFWLQLYDKYFKGEVDKLYISVAYNPAIIPESVVAFNKKLLDKYPEVIQFISPCWKIPEQANRDILPQVKEPLVGLIENDGFIYGKGIVDQCFRLLEDQNQDLVAPEWALINDPEFINEYMVRGFMRCFFFCKKELLDSIELDFHPRTIPAGNSIGPLVLKNQLDLDCFGWISCQILTRRPKYTIVPCNLFGAWSENFRLPLYGNYKWVHIRQISSSAIGVNTKEFSLWNGQSKGLYDHIFSLFNENFPNNPAEWIYKKAIALKLLFLEYTKDKQEINEFAEQYKLILETVADCYSIPKEEIARIQGFFTAIFQL